MRCDAIAGWIFGAVPDRGGGVFYEGRNEGRWYEEVAGRNGTRRKHYQCQASQQVSVRESAEFTNDLFDVERATDGRTD